jgi:hypothetical protein
MKKRSTRQILHTKRLGVAEKKSQHPQSRRSRNTQKPRQAYKPHLRDALKSPEKKEIKSATTSQQALKTAPAKT